MVLIRHILHGEIYGEPGRLQTRRPPRQRCVVGSGAPASRGQEMTTPQHRFLIIADGEFGPLTSKTANSCIRYFPERIVAVLDRKQAGKTVQDVLVRRQDPVVGDFERGIAQGTGATAVLIGIAPLGGRLPDEWKAWLRTAIEQKLEIWSGLHTFVGDDPVLGPLAKARGVRILDARRPPPNLPIADGRAGRG